MMSSNDTAADDHQEGGLDVIRQPIHLLIVYCLAYGLVWIVGLIGNAFVVLSVLLNSSMRSITNYFIFNLALADLLIIIFCLPATLMNNILTEWPLGDFACRASTWINATTSCASVYTLVAVTADRYCAICHTMRYNVFDKQRTLYIIVPIWVVSASLFVPWFVYYKQISFPIPNTSEVALVCTAVFPDPVVERVLFVVVNFLIAFVLPFIVITACYTYIFVAIFKHRSIAVDKGAVERDQRVRMRVTNMMLTVIILFAISWLPLYCLFMYYYFGDHDDESGSATLHIALTVLRPIFQWLSLANSCINPILYAYFSQKFRTSFHELLVLPCRQRYLRVRQITRETFRGYSHQQRRETSTCSNRSSDNTATALDGYNSRKSSAAITNGRLRNVHNKHDQRPSVAKSPLSPCTSSYALSPSTTFGSNTVITLADMSAATHPLPHPEAQANCQQVQASRRLLDDDDNDANSTPFEETSAM